MDTSITFSSKVKTSHLTRNAYLYIRQSTLRQVYENLRKHKTSVFILEIKLNILVFTEA